MESRIILSILAILMLIVSIRSKDKWNIGLTAALLLCLLITLIKIPSLIYLGLLGFTLTTLVIAGYIASNKQYSIIEKLMFVSIGLIIFLQLWSKLFHLPIASMSRLFGIFPVVLYVILICRNQRRRILETGFATVLIGFCIVNSINIIRALLIHGFETII